MRGGSAGRSAIGTRILFALALYTVRDGVDSGREVMRQAREHDARRSTRLESLARRGRAVGVVVISRRGGPALLVFNGRIACGTATMRWLLE